MDEKAIDAKGLAPLQPELDRIRNLKDKSQLAEEIAHLHRNGVAALFEFSSGQDFKDSNSVIAQLDQGGLGLPDRDYYLKDGCEIRRDAPEICGPRRSACFELAGEKPDQAEADAATVMRIETGLAKGSLDLVSRRDPEKVYHDARRPELAGPRPGLPLEPLPYRQRRAGVSERQRGLAGFLQGHRRRRSKPLRWTIGKPI